MDMKLGEYQICSVTINLEADRIWFYTKRELPGPYNSKTPVIDLVTTCYLTPDSAIRSDVVELLQEAMGIFQRERKKGAS